MLCPDCFSGTAHKHDKPKGKEEFIHGYRTYVAGPSNSITSKSSIFFLTDGFGLGLVNNLLLADRFAAETGCRVLVPDIIPGGAFPLSVLGIGDALNAPVGWNIFVLLKKVVALFRMVITAIPFMLRARPPLAVPEATRYARAMRAELPPGGKLGVAGYCWGGYSAIALCEKSATEESEEPLIDAHFDAHPSFVDAKMVVKAIKKFRVPFSCAVAEKDMLFGEKKAHESEVKLREEVGLPHEVPYEFVIYKDCKHSFAVRADPLNDKIESQGMEDAAVQAINWFNRFLNDA